MRPDLTTYAAIDALADLILSLHDQARNLENRGDTQTAPFLRDVADTLSSHRRNLACGG